MLRIGYGNYVKIDKVLLITANKGAPLKRLRQNKEDLGLLIDATNGKQTRSLIHLRDGFMVLSAVSSETLVERLGW